MQDATQKHVCVELNKWAGGPANFIILLCESPNSVFLANNMQQKSFIFYFYRTQMREEMTLMILYTVFWLKMNNFGTRLRVSMKNTQKLGWKCSMRSPMMFLRALKN